MPDASLSPGENPSGDIFIPKDKLGIINDAATALKKKREEELEKAEQGIPKGSEI